MAGVSVGFLENITGVNFAGGNWCAIYSIPDQNASVNLDFSWPDIEKGTPGLPWCIGSFAPSYFVAQPRTLNAAALKEKHKSASTLVYTAFGVKRRLTVGTPADVCLMFIKMDGELATGDHRLRLTLSVSGGHGSNQPLTVAMFSAKTIKVGYKIPPSGVVLAPDALPGVGGFVLSAYNSSEIQDFIVNSKNLTAAFA